MSNTSIGYASTSRTLASLTQQRATGELTLLGGSQQWKFYFFHGRLLYGTGSYHRSRRWYRAVRQHCPNFTTPPIPAEEPWEYHLLSQCVSQNRLSPKQAQAVTTTTLEEVLFSWISNPAMVSQWSEQRFSFGDNTALSLLLSGSQLDKVLQHALQTWRDWRSLDLGTLSPSSSPILRQPMQLNQADAPPLPANLGPLLNGRHTLWDIASYVRRPVPTVTRFLLPWFQQGAIALEEIADLSLPVAKKPRIPIPPPSDKPLIACIDDSPTVGKVLASILEPAGYRVITIQEPLLGMATLVKSKPDLILLDLVMPDTSGYNLCNFLRKTPAFCNTPIIILTSQDGLLDRTRAHISGASDFLTKPSSPQVILTMVQTHLRSYPSENDGNAGLTKMMPDPSVS